MRPANRQQLEAAGEALERILKFDRPADAVLHQFFGDRRALGSHDRAFVAETVFGVLRHQRLLDRLAPSAGTRLTVLAYLVRFGGASVRELSPVLRGEEAAALARIKSVTLDDLPLGVHAELPDWVIERLQERLSDSEILELGRALQHPAPLDLRVNPLRKARDDLLREFAASGIAAQPTPYSPLGVRLREKPAINRHPRFLDGSIEVQDEGSQILAYLVAPRRGELVVDFCAGAGGKALMLGALMHSQGRVYAFDFDVDTGDVSNKRLFLQFTEKEGSPDGMCTDAEGGLWIAHWGASRVTRHDTAGNVLRTIHLPCSQVSSCTFGGSQLTTIFITTASVGLSPEQLEREPMAGGLFALDIDIAGVPANLFRG